MISGVIFCHKFLVVHCAGSNASKKKKNAGKRFDTIFLHGQSIPVPTSGYNSIQRYFIFASIAAPVTIVYLFTLFRYDLVDVTRQSLQLIAITNYDDMIAGFKANSTSAVQAAAVKLYEVFVDMDAILSSNQYFLLGHWLNSAKALATNSQEKELYEYNARNQVTLWGPRGNIDDYANKMWGGLVNTYYKPRWELFESYLVDAISNGTGFKPDKFNAAVLDHETKWTQGTASFPDAPVGDTLTIAKKLHGKYRPKNDQFFCCSVNI